MRSKRGWSDVRSSSGSDSEGLLVEALLLLGVEVREDLRLAGVPPLVGPTFGVPPLGVAEPVLGGVAEPALGGAEPPLGGC